VLIPVHYLLAESTEATTKSSEATTKSSEANAKWTKSSTAATRGIDSYLNWWANNYASVS
jgi:hypothetical protein